MAVDVHSYNVPKGTEYNVAAQNCIDFLYTRIDSNIVTGKSYGNPSWVGGNDAYDSGEVIGSFQFSYHGTDFCIIAYKELGVNRAWMYCYAKNERGIAFDRMHSFSTDDYYDKTYNILIGQNEDYFLFRNLNNQNNCTFLVVRIDAPTNPNDTDTFVSIINRTVAYNKPFDVEDIVNASVRLVSDAGSSGQLYNLNFSKNYYNNKIPLYNIYAFTNIQGIRGKISNLIVLPNSYNITIGTFYSVNGVVYIGLGDLGNVISSDWRGILLRCF